MKPEKPKYSQDGYDRDSMWDVAVGVITALGIIIVAQVASALLH
jgi:hypothetical protein